MLLKKLASRELAYDNLPHCRRRGIPTFSAPINDSVNTITISEHRSFRG